MSMDSSVKSGKSNRIYGTNHSSRRGQSRDMNKNRKKLNISQNYDSTQNINGFEGLGGINTTFEEGNKFPALGLRRFDFLGQNRDEKHINPFRIHRNTEKLLIAREKDRIDQKRLKDHRKDIPVYKKTISNRSNRAGVIKHINEIPPGKLSPRQIKLLIKNYKDLEVKKTVVDNDQSNTIQKANIFEMTENDLENFTLGKYDAKPYADVKMIQSKEEISAQQRSKSNKMADIDSALIPAIQNKDYLKRYQKESIREYINNGREILLTQIAINDKIEEANHLREYIISEEEQLKEGKRLFEEDKCKFTKYLEDQENKAKEAAAVCKQLADEKQILIDEINELNKEIQETDSEYRKMTQLHMTIECKKFIDELLEFKKNKEKEMKIDSSRSSDEDLSQHEVKGPDFFLTQKEQEIANVKEEQESQIYERAIGFDKNKLMDLFLEIEEKNLFLINNIQDEEESLEQIRRNKQSAISTKMGFLNEVKKNIDITNASIQKLLKSRKFVEDLTD